LFSRIWGNLLIAVVALPFVLFLVRLALLFTRRRARTAVVALAGILPALAAAGAITYLLVWSPWTAQTPRPVTALQVLDEAAGINRLELSSPEAIGTLEIQEAVGDRQFHLRRTAALVDLAPGTPAPLGAEQASVVSLGRRTVTLTVRLPAGTRRVAAVLESIGDFVLFDCSFPFEREEARRYRLAIGAFPPDPLPISITIPETAQCTLALEVDVEGPLLGATVSVPGARVVTRLRLTTRIALAG
jgi:hypothetical protein